MNRKKLLIIGALFILIIAVPITLYLVQQQQEIRSRAQVPEAPSCEIPPVVANVLVEYPSCEGSQCSSASASCKWDALSQATSYSLKIIQVESGEVVRNDTVPASTLKVVFPVTAGKTYQCDVAAVNSCGTGPFGTFSLLCAAEVAITFAPTAPPVSTPVPAVVVALPTPTPVPVVICGNVCSTASPCQAGLNCVQSSNGQSYCSMPAYEQACKAAPSYNACCTAPVVAAPTVEAPGSNTTAFFGIAGLATFVVGGLLFLSAGF